MRQSGSSCAPAHADRITRTHHGGSPSLCTCAYQSESATKVGSMEEAILVIGTGQMGPGIALSFARAGYVVVLSGRSQERLATAARDMQAAAHVLIANDLLTPAAWR